MTPTTRPKTATTCVAGGASISTASPTEENLRWELEQAKIRIQELEAKLRLSEGAFKNTRIKELEGEVQALQKAIEYLSIEQ